MSVAREQTWRLLAQLVADLSQVLGRRWEVVLHDFDQPEASIVAIANGEITGRKVGDSTSALGLPAFRTPESARTVFNYRSRTARGSPMKSSTICLTDEDGKPFGALCLNWDLDALEQAASALQELVSAQRVEVRPVDGLDMHEVLERTIADVVATFWKPASALTRDERRLAVEMLEAKGAFMVRGSVTRAAAALGISRATVYTYLANMRAGSADT